MTDHATRLRDAIGASESYLHAIATMVEVVCKGEGKDYCALLLMIDGAKKELSDAHLVVDEMGGA